MNPEELRRIEELYHAALEVDTEKRAAFLNQACGRDTNLLRRVKLLLDAEERPNGLLDGPVSMQAARMLETQQPVLPRGGVLGSYEVLSVLGRGGMGEVYRARDTKLGREVAIKVLPPEFINDPERLVRFRREAKLLASLNHPNIATIFGLEDSGGIHFLVMELVEGETLAARVAAGPFPIAEALKIGQQIAEALEHAHDRKVIHRDLKPANVIRTKTGRVKMLDFGLAKAMTDETLGPSAGPTVSALPTEVGRVMGTPAYMSPEQAEGKEVDRRTDIWAFGCVLYELLTGQRAFPGESVSQIIAAVLRSEPEWKALPSSTPVPVRELLRRCLTKDVSLRPSRCRDILDQMGESLAVSVRPRRSKWIGLAAVGVLVAIVVAGRSLVPHGSLPAPAEAVAEINKLIGETRPLEAFLELRKAEQVLPGDPQLAKIAQTMTRFTSIQSSPTGAKVEIQDYLAPGSDWFSLGTTPLEHVRIPNGYFRWKVSRPGGGELIEAPPTTDSMQFQLGRSDAELEGMVHIDGGHYADFIAFLGAISYDLAPFDIDQYEVTNRAYQEFVNHGGYQKREYWREKFIKDGKELTWEQAMDLLRDSTGRPGPSTWEAGHFPEGQGEYPVSGVSWYEAAAYAVYAGKDLPAVAQWYKVASPDLGEYMINQGNFGGRGPLPVGASHEVGPFGTYDMSGNVREWCVNSINDRRFILGGAWQTQTYQAVEPEVLPPFDRSLLNGFRTVRNQDPLPAWISAPLVREVRDFSKAKPASDEVFRVIKTMYAYDRAPLHAESQGAVENTADWTKERIAIDAGYGSQRLPLYLFLPKNVRKPFQTVVFFPSARVNSMPSSQNLGDLQFVDYVIKSGRALLYPIYQATYERRVRGVRVGTIEYREIIIEQAKEVSRSIDYLQTRPEIDMTRLAYLGVSQGTAYGVIFAALEDRFRAIVFLDGGFFLDAAPKGGDQVDFAPRLRKPILMVNGRYDFSFPPNQAQLPLFQMLGTPEADKRRVIFETPHDVSQEKAELSKEVLAWLDKYLGRVN